MSTTFSPQTDGQTERLINRTLEECLRNYVDQFRKNWAQLLIPAEYAYNSAPVVTMDGLSPFEVDTGQKPKDPLFLFQSAATHHAAVLEV
jgi:hypothetical protein